MPIIAIGGGAGTGGGGTGGGGGYTEIDHVEHDTSLFGDGVSDITPLGVAYPFKVFATTQQFLSPTFGLETIIDADLSNQYLSQDDATFIGHDNDPKKGDWIIDTKGRIAHVSKAVLVIDRRFKLTCVTFYNGVMGATFKNIINPVLIQTTGFREYFGGSDDLKDTDMPRKILTDTFAQYLLEELENIKDLKRSLSNLIGE